MKARLLNVDGTDTVIEPKNGSSFGLKELYELIGCDMVQMVVLQPSGKLMLMDEEGKLKANAELNVKASTLWGDAVVGKVVICEKSMFK